MGGNRSDPVAIAPRSLQRIMAVGTQTLVCIILTILPCLPRGMSDSNFCYMTDYSRESSSCDDVSKMRAVSYAKQRNCTDPVPIVSSHNEPCTCTPQDYDRRFVKDVSTGACSMTYTPSNGCTGGAEASSRSVVDPLYCQFGQVPCTEGHVKVIYAPCDFVRDRVTGKPKSAMKSVEVIHYFDKTCNPFAKGSIHLPPNKYIACNMRCSAGSFLHRDQCEKCAAGTFSTGGAITLKDFDSVDPKLFTTNCRYSNVTGDHDCIGWHVDDSELKVGAFDPANDWFQDECASDPSFNCHNNLRASLQMSIKLVRDGFVRFKFSVNSEKNFDGLSFFIDVTETPVLNIQSYVPELKEVQFNLTEGYHTLTWVYSKDEKWTRGHDSAAISFIEVDGVRFNDQKCSNCPPGYYSEEGSRECTLCPANYFSTVASPSCTPCDPSQYALAIPRTNCTLRLPCSLEKDATATFSECDANTNTRTKTWSWLEPRICIPTDTDPLPEQSEQKCPPCPAGQIKKLNGTFTVCEFCPPGTARDVVAEGTLNSTEPGADAPVETGVGGKAGEEEVCLPCSNGSVALRELYLSHFQLHRGTLPRGFSSYCTGSCGTRGWRVVHDYLDSGTGHGSSVAVWLELNVTMAMDGEVGFSYSVDIAKGNVHRGFFFYIDDGLVHSFNGLSDEYDASVKPNAPMDVGSFILTEGPHKLSWSWVQIKDNDTTPNQGARLYQITVRGADSGGAAKCERVPEGAQIRADKSSWSPCPQGTYSNGGESYCTPCPANTFNPNDFGGSWACENCLEGTSSLPGSSECMVGDVMVPSSYCTYTPPLGNMSAASDLLIYDLSPLSRLHPTRMFGPVFDDPTAEDRQQKTMFYISVCDRDTSNATCFDYEGKPLLTYACQVEPGNKSKGLKRVTMDRGKSIALHPLGLDPALHRRGFLLSLEGDLCIASGEFSQTNISFICHPDAGYGEPEAWFEEGLTAAHDPQLPFPDWVKRKGKRIPIYDPSKCFSRMVWYSAYACPMCTFQDYDLVDVQGCESNKYMTYKYKQPKVCQSNAQMPSPEDIPCQPCKLSDYEEIRSTCVDTNGQQNVSYQWIHPKICNERLPNAVHLPVDVVAGECMQKLFRVSEDLLQTKYIVLLVFAVLLILTLSSLSIVTWVKTRRMYSMYAKLADMDGLGEVALAEGGNPDDEDEEDEGATEKTSLATDDESKV